MGQHLFSVYVHPGPRHPGYPPGNLFHGRGVPNRVQAGPPPAPACGHCNMHGRACMQCLSAAGAVMHCAALHARVPTTCGGGTCTALPPADGYGGAR